MKRNLIITAFAFRHIAHHLIIVFECCCATVYTHNTAQSQQVYNHLAESNQPPETQPTHNSFTEFQPIPNTPIVTEPNPIRSPVTQPNVNRLLVTQPNQISLTVTRYNPNCSPLTQPHPISLTVPSAKIPPPYELLSPIQPAHHCSTQ